MVMVVMVQQGRLREVHQATESSGRQLYLQPRGTGPREMPSSTRTRYGKKITIQDLGADSSEQYVY
jgi:hypothetical protein